MSRHEEILEQMGRDPDAVADMLVAWEAELSKVMPEDFKDWWESDKSEWPSLARLTIESLREREKAAWETLLEAKSADTAKTEMRLNEIIQKLHLPANTNKRNIAARAVREKCPGGADLLDLKEWFSGISNFSHSDARAELCDEALVRINAMQEAMLKQIELENNLPESSLVRHLRKGRPSR